MFMPSFSLMKELLPFFLRGGGLNFTLARKMFLLPGFCWLEGWTFLGGKLSLHTKKYSSFRRNYSKKQWYSLLWKEIKGNRKKNTLCWDCLRPICPLPLWLHKRALTFTTMDKSFFGELAPDMNFSVFENSYSKSFSYCVFFEVWAFSGKIWMTECGSIIPLYASLRVWSCIKQGKAWIIYHRIMMILFHVAFADVYWRKEKTLTLM